MSSEFRILIVGGYGVFGGRLVELLESDARLTLLVSGRSLPAVDSIHGGIAPSAYAGVGPNVIRAIASLTSVWADYEALFMRRTIYSGIRDRLPAPDAPLYQRVLGQAWEQLAPEIRQLHSVSSSSSFVGRCSVDRGRNPLSWLIATSIGFPKAGPDQGITVTLTAAGNTERWTRSTGGRSFSSIQYVGRGHSEWLVRERFGPVSVDLALVVDGANLRYIVRRWALLGITLPLSLGPRSTAVESVQDGKFRFQVEVSLPLIGLIVRYHGMLTPTAPREPSPTHTRDDPS